MEDENMDFNSNEPLTIKEAAKILGFSISLMYTPEMKKALGAYTSPKGAIRVKEGKVMRMKYGESIDLAKEQKKISRQKSRKIESKLGLW